MHMKNTAQCVCVPCTKHLLCFHWEYKAYCCQWKFNVNNNNNYELYLITDQRGEHNGTPLHKTMFYRKLILFRQAGAPSRYGPRSKYRLRPCSRALVGAAED